MKLLIRIILILAVLYFLLMILAGGIILLEIPFWLAAGWVPFLQRTLPRVHVDPAGCATAAFLLAFLLVGTHLFGNWLLRQSASHPPDEGTTPAPRPWPPRWTIAGLVAVVLLFVSGMAAAGVGHQLGWLFGSGERWTDSSSGRVWAQSMNNLKGMGIGLRDNERTNGSLPAGGTFDALGNGMHGWQTHLLPYVEQKDLYHEISLALPWTHPANDLAFHTRVGAYLNPGISVSQSADGYPLTHYAANSRVMNAGPSWSIVSFADGLGQTILGGEISDELPPWGSPTNWRDPALGLKRDPHGFGGPYPGVTAFTFADGSVRFIKDTIDPAVLRALSTPDGGERIDDVTNLGP